MEDKDKINQYFNDWLSEKRCGAPFEEMMNELLDYGKSQKAKFVYNKCVKNRKFELAEKIAKKYNLKPIQSDRVLAMQLSMMAQQKLKNNEK